MHGKKHIIIASGLAALSLTSSAFATMAVPAGWYVEGNLGSTHVSNQRAINGANISNSGLGANVDLGYKFMPYVGVEFGASQYAKASIKNSQSSTKAATQNTYSFDLALRGILPISSSGFEIFAKVGADRIHSKYTINNASAAASLGIGSSTHSATGLYLGIGAQYYFTPELAVNVQWARANGNNTTGNYDLLSGGASFIFD